MEFHITAKPGISGTYWFQIQHAWYLEGAGATEAGPNGVLVAGTGQPDYVPSTSTILPLEVGCTSPFNVPGVGSSICASVLYYRITDVTNSTQ